MFIFIYIISIVPILGYACNFEDIFCSWGTIGSKGFLIEKARDGDTRGYPSTDVTLGTEEGYYALASGEGGFSPQQSTRFMISPCFGSSGPDCHLKFSSVIYGLSDQERIIIYIQKNCSAPESIKPIGSAQGALGKRWEEHIFNIGEIQAPFKIVLVAQVFYNDSFIALDDISTPNCNPDNFHQVSCDDDEFHCSSSFCISDDRVCNLHQDCLGGEDEAVPECDNVPGPGRIAFENCDFYSGSCWWHNVNSDHFDWLIGSGAAPSMMGPLHDHTTELYDKSGHYVYIATAEQTAGHKAIIESAVFRTPDANDGSCKIRFFYHMYGRHVFKLKLTVKELCKENNKETEIWSKIGRANRNEWIFKAVPLVNITGSFVLRFTAYVGYEISKGDIAVDDITLSQQCFNKDDRTRPVSTYQSVQCEKGNRFTILI